MFGHDLHTPQGYFYLALIEGLSMASSYLTSTITTTHVYATATPTLISAPDGPYIISHLRKDSFSQLTSYVISLAHYQ
jgi:hypothetical protein